MKPQKFKYKTYNNNKYYYKYGAELQITNSPMQFQNVKYKSCEGNLNEIRNYKHTTQ